MANTNHGHPVHPECSFHTVFAAESHLEQQGFHCENERWVRINQFATVVAIRGGAQIKFHELTELEGMHHDFH